MGDPGVFRGLAQLEAEGLLELRVQHFFYAEFLEAIDEAGLVARFGASILRRHPFRGVQRPAAASPATGSAASHRLEQDRLLEQAFA